MRFEVDVAARVGERAVACAFAGDGGVTVLVGASGAGKTSVLNMIAGLRRPERGRIRLGARTLFDASAGIDEAAEARRIGYVFQDARLFPHRRVRANLLYAARGRAPADFDAVVDVLGLAHLLDRWPAALSGGEARRVAIGRALFAAPELLLLDEPLSSLDGPRRAEIERAITELRARGDRPIVLVTHDLAEARRLGDRVVTVG